MSWSLRKSGKALDDLTDIYEYIAADNPAAADKLVTQLLDAFDYTAEFPEIGRAAEEIRPGFRLLTRASYLMIYRLLPDEQVIELVRVVHGARDWPMLFEE